MYLWQFVGKTPNKISAHAKCLMHVTSEARDKDIATDLRAKTESCNQSNKSKCPSCVFKKKKMNVVSAWKITTESTTCCLIK